jgi:hypothetical protein
MKNICGCFVILTICTQEIQALAASPWAPSTWTITLNLGREKGTFMPESWGASGGRLVVPIQVRVDSEACSEPDSFVGSGANVISPLGGPPSTYINTKGSQPFEVSGGGWTLEFPPGGNQGLATKLRFWMDVARDADRNDVFLQKGERLCFAARAWREEELEVGLQQMAPIQRLAEETQRRLEAQLSHDSGDRRLDGKDGPLETIKAYGDMTRLVADRDLCRQQRLEALVKYPPVDGDETLPEGPWPGAVEWLSLSKSNPVFVVRKQLLGEEFHVVGTWDAAPVLDDEDYEEEEGSSILAAF